MRLVNWTHVNYCCTFWCHDIAIFEDTGVVCEELSRRLYFYVGLRKIGGIVVLHPQPYNPADSADLFDQNKLYFFSKSSSYWRSLSQHKIFSLFFSRRKLKEQKGRRSESELFYQIQWGLEVSSISFSKVGRSYFNVSQYIKCKPFVSWLSENVFFIKLKRFALNVYGSSKVGLTSILWLIWIINWRITCINFGALPISLNDFATTTASSTAITVYQLCWPLLIAVHSTQYWARVTCKSK